MNLSSETDATYRLSQNQPLSRLDTFPTTSLFVSTEQKRRFELLRLAFFVLKLRKLEQRSLEEQERQSAGDSYQESRQKPENENEFHMNLLRHAIFQQVLTLINLDARQQAMQIITACRS